MKKFLMAAAGLVALATPAFAADMAPAPRAYTKAPPPVVVRLQLDRLLHRRQWWWRMGKLQLVSLNLWLRQ